VTPADVLGFVNLGPFDLFIHVTSANVFRFLPKLFVHNTSTWNNSAFGNYMIYIFNFIKHDTLGCPTILDTYCWPITKYVTYTPFLCFMNVLRIAV